MTPIKCLVTDDEPLAMDVLANYIDTLDYLKLEGRCNNAIETLNFLQRNTVDLLFLDIQMPRLTGVELLRTLKHPPKVIFTTAYRDYALEGYELNVLDYLLKPISFDRFLIAVNKFHQLKPAAEESGSTITTGPFLYVKANKKTVRVFLKDILYIESLRDYIRIKTISQDIITHENISHIEDKLPGEQFLRVHRSFIVALDKIESFTTNSVDVQHLEIPIGRFYKSRVLSCLQNISFT